MTQDAESVAPRKWYVICCRDCDGEGEPLPMPFETPEARGRWAAEHKRGTGHDRWFVIDQPREQFDGGGALERGFAYLCQSNGHLWVDGRCSRCGALIDGSERP